MMTRFLAVVLSVGLGAVGLSSALAQDMSPEFIEVREGAQFESYIWFAKGAPTADDIKAISDALKAGKIPFRQITLGQRGGLLVLANVAQTRKALSSKAVPSQSVIVERNPVLVGFQSECIDGPRGYNTEPATEWGVKRVWDGNDPTPFSTPGKAVWIIDSGVSDEFGAELNLVSRLNCLRPNCPADNKKDKVGHGTFIAGIIGAKTGNGKGVRGVAPDVPINSMRVVKGNKAQADLDAVSEALSYLQDGITPDPDPTTPTAGDVIILSYGSLWTADAETTYAQLEQQLRDLADLGFRIALAAGNTDTLNFSGYVHEISPARAGGYRASAGGGSIMTASAIDDADEFWEYSAFGNYYTRQKVDPSQGYESVLSLPDFAEPGVEIVSLWPGVELAQCSGTSFASAHLAGILLYGPPNEDGKAAKDKSAEKVGEPGQYEDSLRDPIGIKP